MAEDLLSFKQNDLKSERKMHVKAATDLMYPVECIQRLKEAKTGAEMDRIMAEYRRKKYK